MAKAGESRQGRKPHTVVGGRDRSLRHLLLALKAGEEKSPTTRPRARRRSW